MQQTLSQMNDRTEELEKLLEQKETANKLKAEAEKRLAVSGGTAETYTP
jgi:GMP synthase-like glutamine amidotransferase